MPFVRGLDLVDDHGGRLEGLVGLLVRSDARQDRGEAGRRMGERTGDDRTGGTPRRASSTLRCTPFGERPPQPWANRPSMSSIATISLRFLSGGQRDDVVLTAQTCQLVVEHDDSTRLSLPSRMSVKAWSSLSSSYDFVISRSWQMPGHVLAEDRRYVDARPVVRVAIPGRVRVTEAEVAARLGAWSTARPPTREPRADCWRKHRRLPQARHGRSRRESSTSTGR